LVFIDCDFIENKSQNNLRFVTVYMQQNILETSLDNFVGVGSTKNINKNFLSLNIYTRVVLSWSLI